MIIKIVPPRPNIHQRLQISNVIKQYRSLSKQTLQQLQSYYQSFRIVRIDGNSLFRAIGFQYMRLIHDYKREGIFNSLSKLNFTFINRSSIPKQFQKIFTPNGIKLTITQYWNACYNNCYQNNNDMIQALRDMLNQHWALDFVLVIYLRSLCIQYYEQNKSKYKNIDEQELQDLKNYGKQGSNLAVTLLQQVLNISILVHDINKPIKYQIKAKQTIHLLSKPPYHYSIIQPRSKPLNIIKQLKFPNQQNYKATVPLKTISSPVNFKRVQNINNNLDKQLKILKQKECSNCISLKKVSNYVIFDGCFNCSWIRHWQIKQKQFRQQIRIQMQKKIRHKKSIRIIDNSQRFKQQNIRQTQKYQKQMNRIKQNKEDKIDNNTNKQQASYGIGTKNNQCQTKNINTEIQQEQVDTPKQEQPDVFDKGLCIDCRNQTTNQNLLCDGCYAFRIKYE